jgi:hypothetical protein
MKAFLCFCIALFTLSPSKAQDKATIAKFDLACVVSSGYDIWDDDQTSAFTYENSDKKKVTIRTVDTVFSYATQTLARRLNLQLDEQQISSDSKKNMFGKITGFPNEKIKSVIASGNYDRIIDISATALPGPGVSKGIGPVRKKKYKLDMIVEVKVYDKGGSEVQKFKKRTRMDEVRQTVEVFGVRETNELTGNEFLALFAQALDNALDNAK